MLGEYLEVYKEAELRLYEFSLLVLIYEKNTSFIEVIHERNFIDLTVAVRYLETKGYVKQYGEKPTDVMLRKAGENLFNKFIKKEKKIKKIPQSEVAKWFNMWREIFPTGSNNLGYRYRGNRLDGLDKMTKFVNNYPEYTKEDIFQATRNYVERFAVRGYNYMQQAHYFIEKKGVGSALASECEGLEEQSNKPKVERHGERLI